MSDAENDASTVTFTYPNGAGGTASKSYPNVSSNTSAQLVGGIPAANIPSIGTYSWTVTASNGGDSSTATCYFKVDNTLPDPPSFVTADGLYPDDDNYHGSAGKTGLFTIAATGTLKSSVVKYVWGPATGPQRTVTTTAGAPVTVAYTPTQGANAMQVYAYTSAGAQSARGGPVLYVNGPSAPAGDWLLDGDGTDTGTGGHAVTASNVTWTANGRQIGQSVGHFNGSSSFLLSTSVPVHTNTSFSVSAWVRPTGSTCTHSVAAQDGVHDSGFYFGCSAGNFAFDVVSADNTAPTFTRALSTAAAPIGVWSNLVGVYDLGAGTISLYVNGVLQSTQSLSADLWDAAGPFTIGRDRYNDTNGWWTGDISDVHVWDRVVFPADIAALTASSWAGQYLLSNDLTRDAKGSNTLTWTGSPTTGVDDVNPPGSGGGAPAAVLNAANPDYATGVRSSVRTDGSFTVSAWVNPATLASRNMNAVSQNGTVQSNFGLGVSSSNRYDFLMQAADQTNANAVMVQSTATAVAGAWVNLIGTFDATTKVMTLYVNGVSQATVTFSGTPWNAAGPVMIGAGQWNGGLGFLWDGGIDSVGLFNGVLNATEIANLYQYNDPYNVSG
ncbi:LamG domain-containing protein [Actinoplanes subtropicus]|uniref:LamG domain-containing protein n=1 Tax=Actinoplanes subtropicus TaxID=543632 RepID=UPI0004C30F9B|nr:LamG domain-containing protein [Actinoplanes subtropicus]